MNVLLSMKLIASGLGGGARRLATRTLDLPAPPAEGLLVANAAPRTLEVREVEYDAAACRYVAHLPTLHLTAAEITPECLALRASGWDVEEVP